MEKVVNKEWTKAKSADSGSFFHFTSKMLLAMGDDLSYGLNTLGPLCLWQCFLYFVKQPGHFGLQGL